MSEGTDLNQNVAEVGTSGSCACHISVTGTPSPVDGDKPEQESYSKIKIIKGGVVLICAGLTSGPGAALGTPIKDLKLSKSVQRRDTVFNHKQSVCLTQSLAILK